MKKRIAGLVSLLMLLNVLFSAAWVHAEAKYEYIDSAYSPEKGIFIVMGKDFSTSSDTTQVWVSRDLENWETKVFSKIGRNYGNIRTQQNLVWWPAEQVFVLALGGSAVYTSADGLNWKERPNLNVAGSGNIVETNGQRLILGGNNKYKVIDTIDEVKEPVVFASNKDVYVKSLGITSDQPYQYMIGDKDAVFAMDSDLKISTVSKSGMVPQPPIDQAYAPECGGWFMITGEAAMYYKGKSGTDTNVLKISGLPTHEGTSSAELSAIAVNEANDMLVGAKDGSLFATSAEGAYDSLEYMQVEPAPRTEAIQSQIGSISAVDESTFLFAAGEKIYLAKKEDGKYTYYESGHVSIQTDAEDLRIEIPAQAEETFDITPRLETLLGRPSTLRKISSCYAMGDLPAGVTVQDGTDSLAVTVSPDAETGSFTMSVEADNGTSQDFEVTLVNEKSLQVDIAPYLLIPKAGEDPIEYTLTAKVMGTDGKEMNRDVRVELLTEVPEGTTFQDGKLTVTSETENCEIRIRFTSAEKPDIFEEFSALMEVQAPAKIKLTDVFEEITVPESGEQTYQFRGEILDQLDTHIKSEKITWEASRIYYDAPGITMDAETGLLTVKSTAELYPFTIRATSVSNEELFSEINVNCAASDERCVNEQMDVLTEKLTSISSDVMLSKQGLFGTTVTWESENKDLIPASGEIICPRRQAGGETNVKITVSKGDVTKTKTIKAVFSKADSTGMNSDIEWGTTEGWAAEDGAIAVTPDAHTGKYALSVQKEVYRDVKAMTTESSYAFTAFIKAPKGTKVEIYSQKLDKVVAQATAKEGYTEIKDSYDYRVKDKTFDDKIYIRADGEFLVDDFKMFEITTEYLEATKAVANAEYTKKKADVDDAREVVEKFYDLPVRDKLIERLDAIKIKSEGGSGGGGHTPSTSSPAVNPVYPAGENQGENDYKDALDTAMLKFKDMKGHWAKEDVEYMAGLELVSGKEEGVFAPDDTVTRAEFAVLVTRAMGLPAAAYENSFFDVVEEDWYSGYVQAAKSAGYMNGSDGLFRPNDPITREEIAKVIVAAYNEKTGTKLVKGGALYFNDIDEIGAWAYDYIVEAVDKGFVAGISEDTFSPKANATRAQAVVMLRRVYDELQGGSKAE